MYTIHLSSLECAQSLTAINAPMVSATVSCWSLLSLPKWLSAYTGIKAAPPPPQMKRKGNFSVNRRQPDFFDASASFRSLFWTKFKMGQDSFNKQTKIHFYKTEEKRKWATW